MIAVLLLAVAAPQLASEDAADVLASATQRLRPDQPVVARQRYRIGATGDLGTTSKDRAIAADGQDCRVIGARRCTSRPRTLLSAAIEP